MIVPTEDDYIATKGRSYKEGRDSVIVPTEDDYIATKGRSYKEGRVSEIAPTKECLHKVQDMCQRCFSNRKVLPFQCLLFPSQRAFHPR